MGASVTAGEVGPVGMPFASCEETEVAARTLPMAPSVHASASTTSTPGAADPTWAALVAGGAPGLVATPLPPPETWLEHPVVMRAHAYLRQANLDQKFVDMDAELHACVAAEASAGLGPLRPLPLRGGAGRRDGGGAPRSGTRTGLGAELGRLRERPLDGLGQPAPEPEERVLRRLQAEADAEAAHDIAAVLYEDSSELRSPPDGDGGEEQNEEELAQVIAGDGEDDEAFARRLQADLDEEAAREVAVAVGETDDPEASDDAAARARAGRFPGGYNGPVSPGGRQGMGADPAQRRLVELLGQAAIASRQGTASSRAVALRNSAAARFAAAAAQHAARPAGGAEADLLRRVLELSAGDNVGFAAPRADPTEVAMATSTVTFRGSAEGGVEEECSICREGFEDGEQLRLLPCFHRFHVACIDRWLAQSRTCPVCKHDITH